MPNKFLYRFRSHSNDLITRTYDVANTTAVADWTGFGVEIDKWVVPSTGAGGGFFDEEGPDDGLAASSPLAQKDLSAIIELLDSVTGSTYIRRLPMPNLSKAADGSSNPAFTVQNGVTVFNPDHADYATFKSEIETHLISDNGNACTLQRIYIEE
jgi:hypothetical protein